MYYVHFKGKHIGIIETNWEWASNYWLKKEGFTLLTWIRK